MHSARFLPFAGPLTLAAVLLLASSQARAGSDTWAATPSSGDWNTAANWRPTTVPNATTDIATFGTSNVTALSITNTDIDLDSAVFNSGGPPYTITVQTSSLGNSNLNLNGAGIINNSGVLQSFVISSSIASFVRISFYDSASAGEMTTFSTTTAGAFGFYDSSSAGSAIFNLTGATGGTNMDFADGATAANATINASGGAYIIFYNASGGNATFNLTAPSFSYLQFGGNSNAEHANVTCNEAGGVLILGTSSAGDGTYTMIPGNTPTETADTIYFADSATAGSATFVLDGSMGPGLLSSTLLFFDTATAANANVAAYGGSNGGPGAAIEFHGRTDGGTASFALLGNSTLDIGKHMAAPTTLGSLSGSGTVYLGARTLALGSNNVSTTFSGVIQDSGGISHNTGGSLTKVGTGTLILSGANLYTGTTTVNAGVLRVSNQSGSATGPGAIKVNRGTLGGKGIIAGAVTVGTGTGDGAILQPSIGVSQTVKLTVQSSVTFKADSTYTYKLSTQKAKADQVVANGVTIESGAQFNFTALANKRLAAGTVFTAIGNTAATPISGTFANLADGSTLTAGPNNLLVTYAGGDGNDLTLTVH